MKEYVSKGVLENFYEFHKDFSSVFLFFMMFFSAGFFMVSWVYNLNKRFENFDFENSPDSRRGLVIMFFLPIFWVFTMFIFKVLMFRDFVDFLFWLDLVGWFIIMFLALQYLYDFCVCFGKFTVSNGWIWYVFLWLGFFPLLLLPFSIFYFWPMIFFPIVTIPLMQRKMNLTADRINRGVDYKKFYF